MQKLIVNFFLVLIVSLLATPLVCDALIAYFGILPWPFARVFNRVILASIILICALSYFKSRSKPEPLNLKQFLNSKDLVRFLTFFLLTAGSTLIVVPWIVETSNLIYEPRSLNYLLVRVPKIIIAALLIALIEENFFRKYLFSKINLSYGLLFAYGLTNLIYAAVHFLKPDKSFEYNSNFLDGFRYLSEMLSRSLDASTFQAALALFVVGLILSFVRLRLNSIFCCIALHMGWIFGIKFARYTTMISSGFEYPLGSGREFYLLTFYQAWLAILVVGLVVYLMLPKRLVSNEGCGVTQI